MLPEKDENIKMASCCTFEDNKLKAAVKYIDNPHTQTMIFEFSKDCRFANCTHTHEPGCAVLKALDNHYISQSRYQSYLSMMEDYEEGKYRAKG